MTRAKKVAKEVVKVVPQAVAVVPKKELVLEGDPEQQLQFAQKAASTLMKWVAQKPKKVMINGEQYLEFGDWQILARFYGATLSIDWTKPLERGGKIMGYEAKALVLRNGEVIASAEGMCTRDEKRWNRADEYAIRSMAQTRTGAKALRNAFGWVAELAGMKSTPAEEMDGVAFDKSPIADDAVPTVTYDDHEAPTAATPQLDIPTDPKEQRKMLFAILKHRGVDVTDGATCKRYVADETQLELVESNYAAIIEALK